MRMHNSSHMAMSISVVRDLATQVMKRASTTVLAQTTPMSFAATIQKTTSAGATSAPTKLDPLVHRYFGYHENQRHFDADVKLPVLCPCVYVKQPWYRDLL